jgi:hypothetical protein
MAAKKTQTTKLKFLKHDQYNNHVFTTTPELDKDGYEYLVRLSEKLDEDMPNCFNPLYLNAQYSSCSVRMDKFDGMKFKQHAVYNVEWSPKIRRKQSDKSKYIVLKIARRPQFVAMDEVEEEDYEFEF